MGLLCEALLAETFLAGCMANGWLLYQAILLVYPRPWVPRDDA